MELVHDLSPERTSSDLPFDVSDCSINYRVRKYTLSYGIPLGYRDYDRQVLTLAPRNFWQIAANNLTDYGTNPNVMLQYGVSGLVRSSLCGYVDTTIRKLAGNQVFATNDEVELGSTWGITLNFRPDTSEMTGERVIFHLKGSTNQTTVSVTSTGRLTITQSGDGVYSTEEGFITVGGNTHLAVFFSEGEFTVNANGKIRIFISSASSIEDSNLYLGATNLPVSSVITNIGGFKSFVGYIERVAVHGSVISKTSINLIGTIAASGLLYNPENFIDTAPYTLNGVKYSYLDYMQELAPTHFWRMSGDSGQEPDLGTSPVFGTYQGGTPESFDGPVSGGEGKALYGDSGKYMETQSRVFPETPIGSNTNGFTLAMWTVQGYDWSRHLDDLLGFTDYQDGCGIYAGIKGNAITFYKKDVTGTFSVTVPKDQFAEPDSLEVTTPDQWTLVVLTVNEDGLMRCYANGLKYASAIVSTGTKGIRTGLGSGSKFRLGHNNVNNTAPEQAFSEVAMFDRALSNREIANLYSTAKYGTGLVTYGVAQEYPVGAELAGSRQATTSLLPSLVDEEDISVYVKNFTARHSLDQLVDQASLTFSPDSFDGVDMSTILKPNDYVIIEMRAISLDKKRDSGWVSVGHYMADSNPRVEESENRAEWRVVLRTPTKILNYPLLNNIDVQPDIIKYKNHPLSLQETIPEELRFAALNSDGVILNNWAAYPNPIIEASKFRNLDTPGYTNGTQLNANEVPPKIIIKGARNSVDINTRTGVIRIDTDFYEANLGSGMGDPDPVKGLEATFSRYLSAKDVVRTTITGFQVKNDVWAVDLNHKVDARNGITLYPETGEASSRMYKLIEADPVAFDGYRKFTTVTEGTGDLSWEYNPSLTNVIGPPFLGGPKEKAIDIDGYSAYTEETIGPNQLTKMLRFSGLTSKQSDEGKTIVGIEAKITRWCFSRFPHTTIGGNNNVVGQLLLGWGSNSYFKDHVIQLTLSGNLVGNNLARPNQVAPFYPGYTAPPDWKEVAIYGGPEDTCGLGQAPASILDELGIAIQAKSIRNHCFAGIDGVNLKIYFSDGSTGSYTYKILDYHGGFINPTLEGLAVNDSVVVGNSNAPDKVIREYMLRAGFQRSDEDSPLYFQIEETSKEIEAAVPPLRYSTQQKARGDAPILEALGYVPPNYILAPQPDGKVILDAVVQNNETAIDLGEALSFAIDTSENGVYTQYIANSNSGESINLLLSGSPAIRPYKLDNVATVSAGKDSSYGTAYPETEAGLRSVALRLMDIYDGSSLTPSLNGGDWRAPESFGVLYAQSGRHVWPWTMENTPLFCLDLGTDPTNDKEYLVEALSFTTLNSFLDGTVTKQQVAVYYMDAEKYAYASGGFPQPAASQEKAYDVESYFPEADHPGWELLVDNYETEGEVYIEAADFETGRATRMRFIKVVIIQPQYRSGDGPSDKQARIVINDFRVFSSRSIVATSTLGVSPGFESEVFRNILKKYGVRPYVGVPNGYLDTYEKAKNFSDNELVEFVIDIAPASAAVAYLGVRAKTTVKVWSAAHDRYYYGIVGSVQIDRQAITTITLTDYKADWIDA